MKSILIVLCLVVLLGCSSSTDTPCPGVTEPTGPYTISGHLKFAQPMTLPSDAELICYWPSVNLGPNDMSRFDPSRVFGRGTFDLSANTFSLTFQGIPPSLDTARDSGTCRMAVLAPPGYVLLVSKSQANGASHKWFDTRALLGAIDSSAVVYLATNTPLHGWLGGFSQGYAMGADTAVINTSYTSDSLRAVLNTGLVLRIDTTSSSAVTPTFHFPHNWQEVYYTTRVRPWH